jgi:hypothetical protein
VSGQAVQVADELHCLEQVRLEVLTAVLMNISILWDISRCSLLIVDRRFGAHGQE